MDLLSVAAVPRALVPGIAIGFLLAHCVPTSVGDLCQLSPILDFRHFLDPRSPPVRSDGLK